MSVVWSVRGEIVKDCWVGWGGDLDVVDGIGDGRGGGIGCCIEFED